MITIIEKLNEVLGHELACSWTLRRAASICIAPDRKREIASLREVCDVNCANLAVVVANYGGLPTKTPSPRFSIRLRDESLEEVLDLAHSAQVHILGELEGLLDEPELKGAREELRAIRRDHLQADHLLQAQLN
jgi:hypothetical protein